MFELLINKTKLYKSDNINFLKGYLKDLRKELSDRGVMILEQSDTHFAYKDNDFIMLCEIA